MTFPCPLFVDDQKSEPGTVRQTPRNSAIGAPLSSLTLTS
jgi:hypothetical protein